jgi:DNA-binding MarR family transcriptional regulator
MIRSSKKTRERFNTLLLHSEHKISFEQWLVLDVIAEKQGINQKLIASLLAKEAASISRLIAKLIALKLISRQKDPADKKNYKLYLSPVGFDFINKTKKKMEKEFKEVFLGIHEQELNLLLDILKRIN